MSALPEKENGAKPGKELAPLSQDANPASDKSLAAEASSAHSRINIPLNLENWKALPEETRGELLWFHQWILDNKVGWDEAATTVRYDRSTIFRVLKGTYEGSWPKIVTAIRAYRKLTEQRGSIQRNEFAENDLTKLIFAALNYASANNSITVIEGESRMGKTLGAKEWAARNNHGLSVFVTAPVVGGISALVRKIAERVGVNRNRGVNDVADAVYRAFDRNRILIVDEAHRLLPNDQRVVNPQKIEFLRDLHDQTGCALALLVTKRFTNALRKGAYQYEQLVGRIGMPVRLKPVIKRADLLPIVKQFVKTPGAPFLDEMERIANSPGRLGIMVETLKVASRIAHKAGADLEEAHVRKAIALRAEMSGGEK